MPPRIGLDLVDKSNATAAVDAIRRAAHAGVPMLWATTGRNSPDPLTYFAAALAVTNDVVLGTAIVPTYPRHPAMLATQALALEQLAPGRLRLGIGPSHRPTIEGSYGIPMGKPLDHLREYLTVLRALLSTGRVDFDGTYYSVHSDLNATAEIPLYISALRHNAFRLAGELADGAISWICPLDYLRQTAGPAMQAAAEQAGRPAPRMIAHIPVAMVDDRATMLKGARPRLENYGRLPFYAGMFADAGFAVGANGAVSDDLIDHLVVWGDDATVKAQLSAAFEGGIDEVLVTLYTAGDPAGEEARLCRILAEMA
ncbi:MAG TPA: LLM class flavin-dependent oxidoreductase [Nitrolancea sp.]|jgi:F420-dependent oxidoreductase-like protein|nr:LLM class flavin-dependent oxidoreductase [Nitrolancea sp.]